VTRIVGILLVRDEDRFVEQVVRNVSDFCDELMLVDHRSRDATPRILARLARELPLPVTFHSVRHASRSHDLVAPLAGQDVWVFGVDGDELYDPVGLAALKPRLTAGEFDDDFILRGNVVHCTELEATTATGFLSPPAASMTKLYNFRILESWEGRHPERMVGVEHLVFKPGYGNTRRLLYEDYDWDESPFRCLHVCFVPRSSRDGEEGAADGRESSLERYAPRRLPLRLLREARIRLGFQPPSAYKGEHYRQGDLVTVPVTPFFPARGDAACG
jgi:hypothetical protein